MQTPTAQLDIGTLQNAVRGSAAIRLRVKLQPAGDTGTKVFPPTYAGGVYATEKRRIGGKVVECVLLDSVQSQANRLEQALLDAHRDRGGSLVFPLISVAFPADSGGVDLSDIGEVTTLDAPHRIFDAILRDSELKVKKGDQEEKVPFRKQLKAGGKKDRSPISAEGEAISTANVRNATPLFELCPTALVFGAWDSTGAAGGLGNKFARTVVSEIVGVRAVYGVRTESRIDPLRVEKGEIYEGQADGSYVVDKDQAKKDEKGQPILFKRKKEMGEDSGTPAEVNHGNIPPNVARYKKDDPATGDILRERQVKLNYSVSTEQGEIAQRGLFQTGEATVRKGYRRPGGVTIEYAEQTTLLSLAALRRLRFPATPGKLSNPETDHAARTVLAALALAAVAHQIDPPDYFLRSNCQLVPVADPVFEIVVYADTEKNKKFTLSAAQADELFGAAVAAWKAAWKKAWGDDSKLPWREEKLTLTPKQSLVDLVRRSRELGGEG